MLVWRKEVVSSECFHDAATSDWVLLEMAKRKIISPIESRDMRNMWMLIPLSPQADELLSANTIARSSPCESGETARARRLRRAAGGRPLLARH